MVFPHRPAPSSAQAVGPLGDGEAQVICSDLGLAGGHGIAGGSVGQTGVLSPLLTAVDCNSTAASLNDCYFERATPGDSSAGVDVVGVACDIPNGKIHILAALLELCKQPTSLLLPCPNHAAGTITDIRLQGGSDVSSGRLEVKLGFNGVWGTVRECCEAGTCFAAATEHGPGVAMPAHHCLASHTPKSALLPSCAAASAAAMAPLPA